MIILRVIETLNDFENYLKNLLHKFIFFPIVNTKGNNGYNSRVRPHPISIYVVI